jgi:hypothetical protein
LIEELVNADLVAHVLGSEDSTETERELADRLRAAIDEIDLLVAQMREMEALQMKVSDGQGT